MKKHFLTGFILIVSLFLAACGGTNNSENTADDATDAGTEEKGI